VINGRWLKCCRCDTDMWLPEVLHQAAEKGRDSLRFYCPYGHAQFYVSKEEEARRLQIANEKRCAESKGENVVSLNRRQEEASS
jgi:hypothetical protein